MLDKEEILLNQEESIEIDEGAPILGEYIKNFLLYARKAAVQDDKRVLFYRGQPDKDYSLTPSVFRKGLLEKEHVLIHDLLLNSPYEFSSIENILERLIKMQHYGLPTRLLDVTTNPLVALFFACNNAPDKDGEVIVFYDYMQRPNDIDARCIAALAEYTGSSERQMLGFLTDRGLENIALGRLTKLTHIPIEAPLNNERIKRQQGAFLVIGVHGDSNDNPYQKADFDLKPSLNSILLKDVYGNEYDLPNSIIIPKQYKHKILNDLEVLGINHAMMYPELEHQALFIKKKYEEV